MLPPMTRQLAANLPAPRRFLPLFYEWSTIDCPHTRTRELHTASRQAQNENEPLRKESAIRLGVRMTKEEASKFNATARPWSQKHADELSPQDQVQDQSPTPSIEDENEKSIPAQQQSDGLSPGVQEQDQSPMSLSQEPRPSIKNEKSISPLLTKSGKRMMAFRKHHSTMSKYDLRTYDRTPLLEGVKPPNLLFRKTVYNPPTDATFKRHVLDMLEEGRGLRKMTEAEISHLKSLAAARNGSARVITFSNPVTPRAAQIDAAEEPERFGATSPEMATLDHKFKQLFRRIPHNISILTTSILSGESWQDYGMTISSLASVSISPPLISLNIRRPSHTLTALESTRYFFLYILNSTPESAKLANSFTRGYEKSPFHPQLRNETMVKRETLTAEDGKRVSRPVFDSGRFLNCLRCEVLRDGEMDMQGGGFVRVGDHTLVVARVVDVLREKKMLPIGQGLGYRDGRFTYTRGLGLPNELE